MTTITVNGQTTQTTQTNVQSVLDELELTKGRYAVEVDGNLIPKSELSDTSIEESMIIEVVQAVGGG